MTLIAFFVFVIIAGLWLWSRDTGIESSHEIIERNWRLVDDYRGGTIRVLPEEEGEQMSDQVSMTIFYVTGNIGGNTKKGYRDVPITAMHQPAWDRGAAIRAVEKWGKETYGLESVAWLTGPFVTTRAAIK